MTSKAVGHSVRRALPVPPLPSAICPPCHLPSAICHLPSAIFLDEAVAGTSLHEGPDGRRTLRSQLDPARPTLLVFLRHFGCIFCRQMVKDVRIASEQADAQQAEKRYPRVAFIHQGSPEQGGRFFGRYWPGATAISDPRKRLYEAFGLGRGSPGQIIGPRTWACGLRAMLRGHGAGRPVGDVRMMPGLFLLSPGGQVLQRHAFAHIGDHPDFARYAAQEAPAHQPATAGLACP